MPYKPDEIASQNPCRQTELASSKHVKPVQLVTFMVVTNPME